MQRNVGMIEIDKKGKVRVPRTREGNIFELVCAALTILLWAIVLWGCIHAPEQSAAPSGNAADITVFVTLGVTGTFAAGLCLFSAYHPDTMASIPVRVHTTHGWQQVVRMLRVVAVQSVLLCIGIIADVFFFLPWPVLTLSITFIMILTCIVFCVLLAREQ